MNAANFQNMMGTGPVGMAQPQGQQTGVPMSLQARLIQRFSTAQPNMPMDWRSTIQPTERAGRVMELYVSNLHQSRAAVADTFSRRTSLQLARPTLTENELIQNSLRIEDQCFQSQSDRVSLLLL